MVHPGNNVWGTFTTLGLPFLPQNMSPELPTLPLPDPEHEPSPWYGPFRTWVLRPQNMSQST